MGGGLMQLVAYGAQDIYLTGNPQITFFKVVYRRHTNFSMECIQQTINGTSTLRTTESNGTVTISRNGDLVSNIFVSSTIADIADGESIIKDVEISGTSELINPGQGEEFSISAKVNRNFSLSYQRSFSLEAAYKNKVGVEYKLNPNFSVIGNVDEKGQVHMKFRVRRVY